MNMLKPFILVAGLISCTPKVNTGANSLKQETDDRETLRSIALIDVSAKVDAYFNSVLEESRQYVNPGHSPWTPDLTQQFLEEFAHRAAATQAGSGLGVNIGNLSLEISKLTKAEYKLIKTLDPTTNEILALKYSETRYASNPVDLIDGKFPATKSTFTADHSISPIIRVGDTLIGLDKLGHFLEEGWWYFQGEQQGLLTGVDERRSFGQFMEGDDDLPDSSREHYNDIYSKFCWVCTVGGGFGFFGARSTGVISYADINANESGFLFYSQLAADPGNLQFKILNFPVQTWNEQHTPNKYVGNLQAD